MCGCVHKFVKEQLCSSTLAKHSTCFFKKKVLIWDFFLSSYIFVVWTSCKLQLIVHIQTSEDKWFKSHTAKDCSMCTSVWTVLTTAASSSLAVSWLRDFGEPDFHYLFSLSAWLHLIPPGISNLLIQAHHTYTKWPTLFNTFYRLGGHYHINAALHSRGKRVS